MNSSETVIEILETMDLDDQPRNMIVWDVATKAEFYGKYLEELDDAHLEAMKEVALDGHFTMLFSGGDYLQDLMRANVERLIRDEHQNLVALWMTKEYGLAGLSDFDDATELDNADRARGM